MIPYIEIQMSRLFPIPYCFLLLSCGRISKKTIHWKLFNNTKVAGGVANVSTDKPDYSHPIL